MRDELYTKLHSIDRARMADEAGPQSGPNPIARGGGSAVNKSGNGRTNGNVNKVDVQDRPFHEWYRFVLSYPPHLVRHYIEDFGLRRSSVLLDPFCGCGTTLVEGKLCGIESVGIEANAFAAFASGVKVDWEISPSELVSHAETIADLARQKLAGDGIDDANPLAEELSLGLPLRALSDEQSHLILTDSISPLPLHKVLVLRDIIEREWSDVTSHELLALAKVMVFQVSNLHFGPEVGLGKIQTDASVLSLWLSEIARMSQDLQLRQGQQAPSSTVRFGDARTVSSLLQPRSVDAVITSPPYPNEKDYTRTTRLESVVLGFVESKAGLREMKKTLLRSNTRNVYKGDDDDKWIREHPEIGRIADEIEARRVALKKDSGFEKLYGRVTRLYFGGMARHLEGLKSVLRPGAQLAYVVGDQASYLRVMIRTGDLLVDIAKALGYTHVRTDLFRTRFASATREQLREEVVILRYEG